jgi:hypothetical protein
LPSAPVDFSVPWPLWAMCLTAIVLLAHRDRARRIPRWAFAAGLSAALICVSCGGGGSSAPPPAPPPPPKTGTQAGTYTITVTATSSNAGVQPVSVPVTLIVK